MATRKPRTTNNAPTIDGVSKDDIATLVQAYGVDAVKAASDAPTIAALARAFGVNAKTLRARGRSKGTFVSKQGNNADTHAPYFALLAQSARKQESKPTDA